MKLSYANIATNTGPHIAGICSVLVKPRQWFSSDPVVQYETGRIIEDAASDKNWIAISFIEDTLTFEETPKESKSGDYFETLITVTLNYFSFDLLQILETLRRCELVVLITDKNHRRRFIGTRYNGCQFRYGHETRNKTGGEQKVDITFTYESESPAPFYNVDATPEIFPNNPIDINLITPNYLLVE